jgi:hypothetical protein
MPTEYPNSTVIDKAIAALWNESIEVGVDGYLERGDPEGASAYLNEKHEAFATYWSELATKVAEYLSNEEQIEEEESLPPVAEWLLTVAVTISSTQGALSQRILAYSLDNL